MRVCLFGTYERDYPRNQTLLKAMKLASVDIVECHASLWKSKTHKTGEFKSIFNLLVLSARFLFAYIILIFRYLFAPNHDLVLVGYPGQLDVIVIKWLAKLRGKPLVFDAFLSVYDAVVDDRKLTSKNSLMAGLLFRMDQWSCRLADRVILDTQKHIQYFSDTFRIAQDKFSRLWIGADESLFSATPKRRGDNFYHVLFCGKFTPFHGVTTILEAARILESERDIIFDLVGTGQLYYEIQRKVKELNLANIRLAGWADYTQIPALTQNADLCLGIFGSSPKGNRVIPNKIFEALSVSKPVVTARSEAVEELLSDMESVYFVTPGDATELAHGIITLKNDPKLADKLAVNGHRTFIENANLNCLSRDLLTIFNSALN